MIPAMNIIAWGNIVPWAERRQVEQDLIISRAIVELFSDAFLRGELRFRGGTALNKLHFPKPMRYSEDIDLVRTTHGPIGTQEAAIKAFTDVFSVFVMRLPGEPWARTAEMAERFGLVANREQPWPMSRSTAF